MTHVCLLLRLWTYFLVTSVRDKVLKKGPSKVAEDSLKKYNMICKWYRLFKHKISLNLFAVCHKRYFHSEIFCPVWPVDKTYFWNKKDKKFLASLLLTLNIFHVLFWGVHCWLSTGPAGVLLFIISKFSIIA